MSISDRQNLPARAGEHAYTPMFVFDVALEIDPLDEILERNGFDWEDWERLSQDFSFRRDLMLAKKEIAEMGVSFKRKAAMQAEQYLLQMHELMHDQTTPASTRVDIFKTLAKLGELEPEKKSKDDIGAGSGTNFNIQINL